MLTAAYCEVTTAQLVQLGGQQAGTDCPRCTWHSVSRAREYPKYEYLNEYNISVFQIDPLVPDSARFMKVSSNVNIPEVDLFVRVTGFGHRVTKDSDPDDRLRQVDVPIVSKETCGAIYAARVDFGKRICAGYDEGGCDSWYILLRHSPVLASTNMHNDCVSSLTPTLRTHLPPYSQGDSGGPIIQYSSDDPVVVGVISFGDGFAEEAVPGV